MTTLSKNLSIIVATLPRPVKGENELRFKNKLIGLGSTIIDFLATLYGWAEFCHTKEAVKLHPLLNHDGYLFSIAVVRMGNVADVKVVASVCVCSRYHSTANDWGCNDYALLGRWTAHGVYSVTQMKENAFQRSRRERESFITGIFSKMNS